MAASGDPPPSSSMDAMLAALSASFESPGPGAPQTIDADPPMERMAVIAAAFDVGAAEARRNKEEPTVRTRQVTGDADAANKVAARDGGASGSASKRDLSTTTTTAAVPAPVTPASGDENSDGSNPWRDEIVRTMFGDVGMILNDFSCAIERNILLHGRLYVTNSFLCFYSNLFGFEKKIKIPYSHITCITKEYTAAFIPNAIAVITHRREYIFRSFWDRDECYDLLKDRLDDSLSHGAGDNNTNNNNNNNNNNNTHARGGNLLTPAGATDTLVVMPAAAAAPEKKKAAAAAVEDNKEASPPVVESNYATMMALADAAERDSTDGEEETETVDRIRKPSLDGDHAAFHAATARPLAHVLAEDVVDVAYADFFDAFLSDGAECSLVAFHQAQGDSEVSASAWLEAASTVVAAAAMTKTKRSEQTRQLRFRRALTSSPIGPSSTRTTKTQHCRRFGDRGAVVDTVMTMEDIPYRDCFTIADRWVIEPVNKESSDNQQPLSTATRVRFEHECVFTKSTIFRGRIEASSKTDLTAFYAAYVQHAKRHAAQRRSLDHPATLSKKHRFSEVMDYDDEDDHRQVLPGDLRRLSDRVHATLDADARGAGTFLPWLLVTVLAVVVCLQARTLSRNAEVQAKIVADLAQLRKDLKLS